MPTHSHTHGRRSQARPDGRPETGRWNRIVRAATIVVWLALLGWLVRFEACPEVFTRRLAGYAGLVSRDVLVEQSWMKILYQGRPVGFTRTTVEISDEDPRRRCELETQTRLALRFLGEKQQIGLDTSIYLDNEMRLAGFEIDLGWRDTQVNVEARGAGGNLFDVTLRAGGATNSTTARIPPDAVLYLPMTEMTAKHLRPGRELAMRVLDPVSMETKTVMVRALREERIGAGADAVRATVLATEYMGSDFLTWIDRRGRVLRQDTPWGWRMVACTPEQAVDALRSSAGGGDVLTGMALQLFSQWLGGGRKATGHD